ncbi:MAG: peptidylprolyl isomerase [Clostridia bacterium]|nr:peptidylprolyl isomerase [Clostridia bacterium]
MVMQDGSLMYGELYPATAPNSVGNFVELANSGFYNGVVFHRVIPGFMIQGGDPQGTGMGGPSHAIKGEFASNGVENPLSHGRGVLSMARTHEPDSAGSQFFICVQDSEFLDGEYAAFGKVLGGMDTADRVVSVERDANDKPFQPQEIRLIFVETYGVEYPFEKLPGR